MPLFYPFILNDPAKAPRAKRRSHAVVIDHLTPPMTTADAYDELAQLMQLVDEYYQVEMLDPSKVPLVQKQIWDLISGELQTDLKFLMQQNHGDHAVNGKCVDRRWHAGQSRPDVAARRFRILCRNSTAICASWRWLDSDGLHIFGQAQKADHLVGLLQARTRVPNLAIPSLRGVGGFFKLDLQKLLDDKVARWSRFGLMVQTGGSPVVTNADVLEALDEIGRHLLELLQPRGFC